ncbi:hypothetical protein [Pseudovibrio sp. Tun.PSC04-5.I4]|uniref:hypothetical protein n=1 Tax=Pseudovibrio sp. Tun.PSC04-5.I4 TaxID=1798213 RepID=UPI00088040FF|nr:hypothetical protein [Pseudovibrio sp. Tun.PSC04-5.I4]SDQ99736.1 hypothetical protein SAMN04515695_2236 [Pseudovibrio sp. Tun.PSC04-5.I4]
MEKWEVTDKAGARLEHRPVKAGDIIELPADKAAPWEALGHLKRHKSKTTVKPSVSPQAGS